MMGSRSQLEDRLREFSAQVDRLSNRVYWLEENAKELRRDNVSLRIHVAKLEREIRGVWKLGRAIRPSLPCER